MDRRCWALALLIAGTAAARAAAAAPTLAVAASPYAAPVLIAEAEGYFAAEGLDLNVKRCAIGRLCLKMLLDGQAQFATVADTPITLASFTRRDFSIVATIATAGGDHRMVVRHDHGLRSPADLKGHRVGALIGTSAHYFTDTFLLFHGLQMADVTLVALDPSDPTGPLERGEIDAAGLFSPHVQRGLQRLGARGEAFATPAFFSLAFNLVSAAESAGGRDGDLHKLLRALQRANRLLAQEPGRARAIVARTMGTDAAALADTWPALDFRLSLSQSLLTTLESQARWAMREKLVPASAPMPDYLDFVRSGPLRRLDPNAVRLVE